MWLYLLLILTPQRETFYGLYETAIGHVEEERFEQAIVVLEKAVVLRPDSNDNAKTYGVQFISYHPYSHLAYCWWKLENYEKASYYLEQAFKHEEDKARDKQIVVRMEMLDDFLDWSKRLEKNIQANQPPAQPPYGKIVENMAKGRVEDSLSFVTTLLKSFPEDEELIKLQKTISERVSRDQELEAERQKFQRRLDELLILAREAEANDLLPEALQKFRSILFTVPNHAESIAAVARIRANLLARGESEAAIQRVSDAKQAEIDEFLVNIKRLKAEKVKYNKLAADYARKEKELEERLATSIKNQSGNVNITWNFLPLNNLTANLNVLVSGNVELKFAELLINGQKTHRWEINNSKRFVSPNLKELTFPRHNNNLVLQVTDIHNIIHQEDYPYTFPRVSKGKVYITRTFKAVVTILICALIAAGFFLTHIKRRKAFRERFNPYIAGAPVLQEKMFYGRHPLLKQILNALHNNSLMVYGERRIGKTSFLHQLHNVLPLMEDPQYEFVPVFIDLQGIHEEEFFGNLDHEIALALEGRGIALEEGEPIMNARRFISRLRQHIRELKKQNEKKPKLVLLLDEVDVMNGFSEKTNQQLRSVFMKGFADHIVAVMAGIHINTQWKSEGSPWYNFFEQIELKPFTKNQADELITKPVQGIYQYTSGAVERIREITGGKPYLIQKMCLNLVSYILVENRRKVTAKDVDMVFQDIEKEFYGV